MNNAMTVEEGKKAAELITINILKNIKNTIGDQPIDTPPNRYLGSLDKVERIVKLNGFVNCDGEFKELSFVINGASDLLVKVFGEEIGMHARSAVGAPCLPFNVPVEIDMVVQIKSD